METFLKDLTHSLRMFRQNPGFTITAVAALALGIGATTAIFSVVNTVLLRPMPYPDEEALRAELEQVGGPKSLSPASFLNTTFLDELKRNGFVDKLYK